MKKIFIGLFFVLLGFTLDLDTIIIELIPSFVGYILFVSGLAELLPLSPWFQRVRPWCIGMAIYTGILYAVDLSGIIVAMEAYTLSWGLSLIASAIQIFVFYCFVAGIQDAERLLQHDLNSKNIRTAWLCWCILTIILNTPLILALGLFLIIATWAVAIGYLWAWGRATRLFHALDPPYSPQAYSE